MAKSQDSDKEDEDEELELDIALSESVMAVANAVVKEIRKNLELRPLRTACMLNTCFRQRNHASTESDHSLWSMVLVNQSEP